MCFPLEIHNRRNEVKIFIENNNIVIIAVKSATELEMQKNMFFSNHVFYAKKKVFFIEKNSFLMFFFCFFQL